MIVLVGITTAVLLGLSGLHVYWAAGGRWGIDAVIPTVGGRRTLNPSTLASSIVAIALGIAGTITLGASGALSAIAPGWLIRAGLIVLSVVFVARAVGDFRLIGLTKQVKDTRFAQLDTQVFVPLCVGLSVACGMLAWLGSM